MGKKGSWFSAIRRVFTPNSKEKQKPGEGVDKKRAKEKKRTGKGILRHGQGKSFIPLFREPSSIEKILGEADQLLIKNPPASSEQPKSPPRRPISPLVASPWPASSPRATSPRTHSPKAPSPRAVSPKVASPRAASPKASTSGVTSSKPAASEVTKIKKAVSLVKRPEPTLQEQHLSATVMQAAFRGYLARRSLRAVRGLVRLQGVVKGQSVKRQTTNAMKQMQLLVRVQTQIQSRRIHMLENQALQRQADKEAESIASKCTLNELSQNQDWDDSMLTKEEVDARRHKKVEAVVKRERAMAYSYSHKLWKANPKSSQGSMDIRSNGFPWWWNWLDRQLPQEGSSQSQSVTKNIASTPPRSISGYKLSPRFHSSNVVRDNHDSVTPRSSRSAVIPFRPKQFYTPSRTPPANTLTYGKYLKPRAGGDTPTSNAPLKDDDSLMSCPPFSGIPNYMAPTASAKAKARAYSNPKERFPSAGTPGSESKRRFSFPLAPNIGSFKWNKGANRDTASQAAFDRRSVGDMSVDSTVSMPAGLVGRKPFNRFV